MLDILLIHHAHCNYHGKKSFHPIIDVIVSVVYNNNNNNNNNYDNNNDNYNDDLFTAYPPKKMWLFICEGPTKVPSKKKNIYTYIFIDIHNNQEKLPV